MILISHRGNLNGPNGDFENDPKYILEAFKNGFNVEIDIWLYNNKIMLGHDEPKYNVTLDWFKSLYHNLWLHCKNIEILEYFNNIDSMGAYLNYFWHEKDTATITSKGFLWAYPNKQPIKGSIAVLPELNNEDISKCYGVCSDYILNYK